MTFIKKYKREQRNKAIKAVIKSDYTRGILVGFGICLMTWITLVILFNI